MCKVAPELEQSTTDEQQGVVDSSSGHPNRRRHYYIICKSAKSASFEVGGKGSPSDINDNLFWQQDAAEALIPSHADRWIV